MRHFLVNRSGVVLLMFMQTVIMAAEIPSPLNDPKLKNRSKDDPRDRKYVMPKRIAWQSTGDKQAVENPQTLLEVRSGQVALDSHIPCVLRNNGAAPAILLDFG